MRTSLHVFLKDLRHFWFLAALGIASVLTSTLGAYWNLWHATAANDFWQTALSRFVIDIAQNGPPLVIFIVVIAVMQADLTVGDKAFWRSRPISRGSLLGAKLLFLLAVLFVPAVAGNLFVARAVDAPGPMAFGMVLESTGMIVLVALLAALVASLTGTMIQAVAVVLAAALIFMVAGSAIGSLGSSMNIVLPWELNVAYPGPRIATLGIFGAIALLASLAHQVLTLRTGRTLVLYAILVPLVIVGAVRWPITLASPHRGEEFPATLSPSPGVQIMLKPPAQTFGSTFARDPATRRDVPAHRVSIEADMGNVPLGRIIQVQSVSSKLQFADGTELAFPALDRSFWPMWSFAKQAASICRELGLTPPSLPDEKGGVRWLNLFTIPSEQARAASGRPVRLSATLKLYEIAFHEEMRMPARAGAASSRGGQRWDIREIRAADGEVSMSVRNLVATSMFDPSGAATSGRYDGYVRGMVLLNGKLGEYAFMVDRWGSAYRPPGVLSVADVFFRFQKRWHNDGTPAAGAIDEAWLQDADFVILVAQPVGAFEKTIALDHFQVPQPPDDAAAPEKPFWQ